MQIKEQIDVELNCYGGHKNILILIISFVFNECNSVNNLIASFITWLFPVLLS